jgi:hypothetical protein
MREVQPRQVFRSDFDTILEDAKRQERDPSNRGEYRPAKNIHAYFSNEVLPLIAQNDWLFAPRTLRATARSLLTRG